MQSSRQNLENNMSIHVSCYRLRGQHRHSLLHICIQIMEQQLYFNIADMTITCSCRMFESIGIYTNFKIEFWLSYISLTTIFCIL
jgi:hypothetical protein